MIKWPVRPSKKQQFENEILVREDAIFTERLIYCAARRLVKLLGLAEAQLKLLKVMDTLEKEAEK